jgi:hypothetical protein
MPIDSHIQVPEGILKYFRDPRSGLIWYLNLKTHRNNTQAADHNSIKRTSSGKLGSSPGYYSEETERQLNKTIESPVTNLNSQIRPFIEGKDNGSEIVIPPDSESRVKQYIESMVARSNFVMSSFKKNSLTAQLFGEQENHDTVVNFSMENRSLSSFTQNYKLSILVNKTMRNLVLPRNGFYTLESLGKTCFIAPISPKGAVSLIPNDYPQITESRKGSVMSIIPGLIEDPREIEMMNKYALITECSYNYEFLASCSKVELIALRELWNSKREYYDVLYIGFN